MQYFDRDDVERLIEILGNDRPASPETFQDRRQRVAMEIAEMVSADAYAWVNMSVNDAELPSTKLDCVASSPTLREQDIRELQRHLKAMEARRDAEHLNHFDVWTHGRRDDGINGNQPATTAEREFDLYLRSLGFVQALCAKERADSGNVTVQIFLRKSADRPFSERDLAVLELVFNRNWRLQNGDASVRLTVAMTPRHHELLLLLLAGDSEKEAARKMGISQLTVNGYVKSIYRQMKVKSRSELMAKFIGPVR